MSIIDAVEGTKHLLNDLERLPKQTTKTNAEGYNGETRSINIPATNMTASSDHFSLFEYLPKKHLSSLNGEQLYAIIIAVDK